MAALCVVCIGFHVLAAIYARHTQPAEGRKDKPSAFGDGRGKEGKEEGRLG